MDHSTRQHSLQLYAYTCPLLAGAAVAVLLNWLGPGLSPGPKSESPHCITPSSNLEVSSGVNAPSAGNIQRTRSGTSRKLRSARDPRSNGLSPPLSRFHLAIEVHLQFACARQTNLPLLPESAVDWSTLSRALVPAAPTSADMVDQGDSHPRPRTC